MLEVDLVANWSRLSGGDDTKDETEDDNEARLDPTSRVPITPVVVPRESTGEDGLDFPSKLSLAPCREIAL